MRKNVLVSLLAVTSASVGAYADANLTSQIKNDAVSDWTSDSPEGITLTNGVIASTGATISQSIGKLLPGEYKISATPGIGDPRLFVRVGGAGATPQEMVTDGLPSGSFTVENEAEVVIEIAGNAGGAFSVSNFKLTLVYDFAAAREALQRRVSQYIGSSGDLVGTYGILLSNRAAALYSTIQTLVDDAATSEGAYSLYSKYELYKGVDNCVIGKDIAKLSTDVLYFRMYVKATDAADAYNADGSDYKVLVDKYAAAVADVATGAYVKTQCEAGLEAITAKIAAFKKAAEDAYNGGNYNESAMGAACSDVTISTFTAETGKMIGELSSAIDAAKANDVAYSNVKGKIDAFVADHTAKLKELRELLPGAPDVYEDMYKEAQGELNEEYMKVEALGAVDKNGNNDNHNKAAETMESNLKVVSEATDSISSIFTKYQTMVGELRKAYAAATDYIAGQNKEYDKYVNGLGDLAAQDAYAKLLAEVKGSIDALQAAVEKSNAGHTIDKYVAGADYAAAKAKIASGFASLDKQAGAALQNNLAYAEVVEAIDAAKKELDDAKKAVNALVSDDKAYAVSGKYAAEEADFQTSITDLKTAAEKSHTGNTSVNDRPNQLKDAAAISAGIAAYKADAEAAVEHYNVVAEALVAYNKALATLRETVKNQAVTVYAGGEGATYGSKIVSYTTEINSISSAVSAAMSLTGTKHHDAIIKIATRDAIITELEALTESYAADETRYNDELAANAPKILWQTAKNNYDVFKAAYDNFLTNCTEENVGLAFADLQGRLESIKTKLGTVDAGLGSEYTDQAYDELLSINDVLTAINSEIIAYEAEANKAYKTVEAENAAETTADKAIAAVQKLLTGSVDDKITGVADLNEDPNKVVGFNESVAELQAELDKQSAAVDEARKAEKLSGSLADIQKAVEAIKADVNELRAEAEAATVNWTAYGEINAYYGKKNIATAIGKAKTDVGSVAKGDALVYYNGLIAGYETQLNGDGKNVSGLLNDIKKSYDDGKAAADKASLTLRIDELYVGVTGLKAKAQANETAHDAQVAKSSDVKGYWTEVYTLIYNNDQSTQRDSYLAQLNELQTALNNCDIDIADRYGKGQSSEQNGAIDGVLEGIRSSVKVIADTQSGDYDKIIAADNKARYDKFVEAANKAQQTYDHAVEVVGKFNNIQNPELKAEVDGVIEANGEIYNYTALIRELKADALANYNSVVSPDLFDVEPAGENEKTWLEMAQDYESKINNYLKALTDAVNAKAKNHYDGVVKPQAQGLLDGYVAQLKADGYDKSVYEAAFDDVRGLISKADNAYKDEEFAVTLDGLLDDLSLENVSNLLDAGLEPAAVAEWNYRLAEANKTKDAQLADLNKFEYAESNTTDYLAQYNRYVEQRYDPAVEYAGEAIEAGSLYGDNLANAKAQLRSFVSLATSVYNNAKNASVNQAASMESYEKIMAKVAEAEKSLSELAAYVDGFYYVNSNIETALSNYENNLDRVKAEAEGYRVDGQCNRHESEFIGEEGVVTDVIKRIKITMDDAAKAERDGLYAQIDELKSAYASAEAALSGDSLEGFRAKKYDELIKGYDAELDEIAANTDATAYAELQTKYVAMEKKMAKTLGELKAYAESGIINTVYAELKDAVGELLSYYNDKLEEFNATHANVQAEYKSDMDNILANIEALSERIDSYQSDGTILMYKDRVEYLNGSYTADLEALASEIAKAQVPYTVNDEAYASLSKQVAGLTDKLDALVEKMQGFELYATDEEGVTGSLEAYFNSVEALRAELVKLQAGVDAQHADYDNMLTSDTELDDIMVEDGVYGRTETEYSADIANIDKNATYREANHRISSLDSSVRYLSGQLNNSSNRYYDVDGLLDVLNGISKKYGYVYNYNYNAFRGAVSADIDGVELDKPLPVDYLSEEASPAVFARVAELNSQLTELSERADENKYLLGDVDRDMQVMVNDYNSILAIVLGEDVAEAGTMKYLTADVNEDGLINIGDVTAVTNIINGGARYAISARRAPVQGEDAIGVDVERNGDMQRVVISLQNVRSYVGAQMDIKLPAGVTVMSESLASRASGHELRSNDLGNGTHRIVISSLDNSAFADAGGALVTIDLSGGQSLKGLEITDVMFTDANATVYNLGGIGGEATGIDGVEADESLRSKIYSVGGQLLKSVKNGINIIRNSDGTTTKVIKRK